MKEAPLVAVIVRKIQERYLSAPALARLRSALEKKQQRRRPQPQDLSRLQKDIEKLDRRVDQGAERVMDAPPDIVPTLYRKLESLKAERDSLKRQLEAQTQRETLGPEQDDREIDQAIDALRDLGAALAVAKPEDTKELLSSIVSRIVLHYDHEEGESGRVTSAFREGIIYLRPVLGEGSVDGPNSSHMITKRPYCDTDCPGLTLQRRSVWQSAGTGYNGAVGAFPCPKQGRSDGVGIPGIDIHQLLGCTAKS